VSYVRALCPQPARVAPPTDARAPPVDEIAPYTVAVSRVALVPSTVPVSTVAAAAVLPCSSARYGRNCAGCGAESRVSASSPAAQHKDCDSTQHTALPAWRPRPLAPTLLIIFRSSCCGSLRPGRGPRTWSQVFGWATGYPPVPLDSSARRRPMPSSIARLQIHHTQGTTPRPRPRQRRDPPCLSLPCTLLRGLISGWGEVRLQRLVSRAPVRPGLAGLTAASRPAVPVGQQCRQQRPHTRVAHVAGPRTALIRPQARWPRHAPELKAVRAHPWTTGGGEGGGSQGGDGCCSGAGMHGCWHARHAACSRNLCNAEIMSFFGARHPQLRLSCRV
jgi:hypothetical protein